MTVLVFGMTLVAAVVLLLGVEESGGPGGHPMIEFERDENLTTVEVVAVDSGVEWSEFDVKLEFTGGFWFIGDEEIVLAEHLVFTPLRSEETVEVGDMVRICRDDPDGPQIATLRYVETREIIQIWFFKEAPECPEEVGVEGLFEGTGFVPQATQSMGMKLRP